MNEEEGEDDKLCCRVGDDIYAAHGNGREKDENDHEWNCQHRFKNRQEAIGKLLDLLTLPLLVDRGFVKDTQPVVLTMTILKGSVFCNCNTLPGQ
jgi:hypothetical protein